MAKAESTDGVLVESEVHEPETGGDNHEPETGGDAAPAYITRADFDTWAKEFATKINAEQARLRKRVIKSAEPETGEAGKTEPAAVSMADVQAAMEIGKLEAMLRPEVLEEIAAEVEGLSYPERARGYRIAAIAATKGGQPTHRPETGSDHNASGRNATSARRNSAPHPRTLREYVELAVSDPKKKALLDSDPTFDPSALPRA